MWSYLVKMEIFLSILLLILEVLFLHQYQFDSQYIGRLSVVDVNIGEKIEKNWQGHTHKFSWSLICIGLATAWITVNWYSFSSIFSHTSVIIEFWILRVHGLKICIMPIITSIFYILLWIEWFLKYPASYRLVRSSSVSLCIVSTSGYFS